MAAKSCVICLEGLQFNGDKYQTTQELVSSSQVLKWHGSTAPLLIPATGKAYVSILEILSPNSQAVTTAQATGPVAPPKIRIGEFDVPGEYASGVWTARFVIYSENAKPSRYDLSVRWNGRWEHRLSEMNKILKIQKLS